jgi:hypothetical protein
MDPSENLKPLKKGTGPLGVCPYLGVQDDPATHFAWAKPGHFCYRVRPSQAIEPGHQENFCLNGKYPTCVVYPASWRGPLPANIKDDAYMDWVKRAAVIKSTITMSGGTQAAAQQAEKTTSRFGMDLSTLREQADFIAEEPITPPWWKRREGKYILIGVFAIILIGLVFWAVILSIQSIFSVNSASSEQSPAGLELTSTWEAIALNLSTDTNNEVVIAELPTHSPSPTDTPSPTSTSTRVPDTATPLLQATTTPLDLTDMITATGTATPNPFTCQDNRAYTLDIVRGPILVPEMGYVYSASTAPSNVSAGWILRNTSACTWENVLLLSIPSNRLLVPYIRLNGQLITEASENQAVSVPPGGEIEVGLIFPIYMASGIRSEWAVVINNFKLLDRPHLLMDVNNWVIGLNLSPTRTTNNRPPGSRDRPPADTPPSIRPP